jgi:hypothetical protein
METPAPNYRKEFWKSVQHASLGLLTLGVGFLSATPLGLIIGATAYALGWVYLPDMAFFRRRVDERLAEAQKAAALAEVATFVRRREALLVGLSQSGRQRYQVLAEVCRGIEAASADGPMATGDSMTDPRLRKLDELMWTFLRLLTIEESLERFLETERREDLPGVVQEAEAEAMRLGSEVEALKAKGGNASESKARLLASKTERLEVLRKRLQRVEQARENIALVISEQQRLEEQIKLIRADAVAMKNAESISARIDATVEHLDQTNKWIAEMDEFKDLVGDLPPTELRVGFEPVVPPPLLPDQAVTGATRIKQKIK